MTTFILRTDIGEGTRVAVKDNIDVEGLPTTAGCRAKAVADAPADSDAACLEEIRRRITAGTVRLVGKTNMHELAYGVTGRNQWYGMPRNPLRPGLIPGGSSSGSAVAVASGEADIALGSDTGGSIRIPAACCGIVGLKTTWGRIPTAGTWPLAPSLDTIGPMARDVPGAIEGMRLLEPDFRVTQVKERDVRFCRLLLPADPEIDATIDAALASVGAVVRPVEIPGWEEAWRDADLLLSVEAWRTNRDLLRRDPSGIGRSTATRILNGSQVESASEAAARVAATAWRSVLLSLLAQDTVVALPTLGEWPPPVDTRRFNGSVLTLPVNLAGLPALALPVPSNAGVPASLQLVGPMNGEELLLSVGSLVEAALRSR